MNALQLLRKDHSAVKNLFQKFDQVSATDYETKLELLNQTRRELQIHTQAEEQIFYPAIKAFNGEGSRLVSEALREHRDIEQLLVQLSRLKPRDRSFDEKFETLIENVEHHIEDEEGEIFRFAEENCSPEQLEELAQQIQERKQTLDQQLAA
jgi:hemerythrin superfamily protein